MTLVIALGPNLLLVLNVTLQSTSKSLKQTIKEINVSTESAYTFSKQFIENQLQSFLEITQLSAGALSGQGKTYLFFDES